MNGANRWKNIAFLSAVSIGPIAIAVVAFSYAIAATQAAQAGKNHSTRTHSTHATVSHLLAYQLAWKRKLDTNADSTAIIDPNVQVKKARVSLAIVLAGNNDADCQPNAAVQHATTYAFNLATGKRLWGRSTSGRGRCTTAAPAVWGVWVFSPGLDGKIHKYSAATGAEYKREGWPKPFTRQPYVEKSSSNLVVSGHRLYLATSGFTGDAGHYEGHLVTVDLDTQHETVWNSLCSNIHSLISGRTTSSKYCADVQAGMFGRGQAAIDPVSGDVYVVTGNGPWNGRTDWGDSVLKLGPGGGVLLDAFTPTNQRYLNNTDSDLGSTGPAILPPVTSDGKTYNLLVQGGKGPATSLSGPKVIWLVNRDKMGSRPGPGHLGGQLQHLKSPGGCQILTAPAVWTDPRGNPVVVYGNDCGITAYNVVTSAASSPKLAVRWSLSDASTTPVIFDGMLYTARGGIITERNPSTGKTVWKSTDSGSGRTIGGVHWEYPALTTGWLLMTDESAYLYAYRRR